MAANDDGWIEHYRADGVVMGEFRHAIGESYFVVADEYFARWRVTFSSDSDGRCHVGINAAWNDSKPGELADFTPNYEFAGGGVDNEDVSISDDGLLSALGRQRGASGIDIRIGFTAKLPATFATPIRQVIALMQQQKGADRA